MYRNVSAIVFYLAFVLFPAGAAAQQINVPKEVIFSGVAGTIGHPKPVVLANTGTTTLNVSLLTIAGTHKAAFRLYNPPAVPFTIAAGQSITIQVQFAPPSTLLGSLNAELHIGSNDAANSLAVVGLYGLSAKGEQGSNEPPLDGVVKTLGYNINVGGTSLILGTTTSAIGDETLTPLFKKAGTGPVTLKPVARYSPDDLLPYGYYTKRNGTAETYEIGKIALDQEQTLLPLTTAGSQTSFDPDTATFGFFTGATSYAAHITYTEDALNTGPLRHAVRIYPLKNRNGAPMPNSYLLAFEPASNGDYQDYVFEVTNVQPATTTVAQVQEAEAAVLNRAVVAKNWPGFTGTGFADYINVSGDYIEWTVNTAAPGYVSLQFRYANGSTSNRPLRLETNGKVVRDSLKFIPTGGWDKWSGTTCTTYLASGTHKIRLTAIGYSGPNIDHLVLTDVPAQAETLEAEKAVLYRAVTAAAHSGYTGTGYADYINNTADYIEWTVNKATAGTVVLDFRYANGSTANRLLKVEVNGVVVHTGLGFLPTGAWNKWALASIQANLNAGSNRVRLTATGSSGPNIDHLAWREVPAASTGLASGAQKLQALSIEEGTGKTAPLTLQVLPNRVSGTARVWVNNAEPAPSELLVVDMAGNIRQKFVVQKPGSEPIVISAAHLAPGTYLLLIRQGKETASARFMVVR